MSAARPLLPLLFFLLAGCAMVAVNPGSAPGTPAVLATVATSSELGTPAHTERVMKSTFCADCHPAIYAEHEQNTHGLAFQDTETRLATRNFRREDCIRCHTPRPVFETGIGMTPMQRWTDLEEGNTCMSCHWKKGYDYAQFSGGAQCKTAFDPRVGEVQACASCHRIAGTPDQWSRAEHGHKAGKVCIDCHMPLVTRPVAVGEPPREVRSHVFPASHNEKQLRRAYAFDVAIEGNEVVVRVTNKGAGHNFPTATRQRALESLVTVRDAQGNVVGSSRMVCRYPYASELEPGQRTLPVSTQIPSGKFREQRVPLTVVNGTVECTLLFKIYRPCADSDPELARVLETETRPFEGVTPRTQPITDAPMTGPAPPAASVEEFLDPAGFCNTARPEPGSGPIEAPEGKTQAERLKLVAQLESHLPEVRRRARERLVALGPDAAAELVRGLCVWSNETFNEAQEILVRIGRPMLPALRAALSSPELYVRCHARNVIARIGLIADDTELLADIEGGLALPAPLDRRSTIEALGLLGDKSCAGSLERLLADEDPDVVCAAARALARLDARAVVPALQRTLAQARSFELRCDLARALCELGDPAGVPVLIEGLDQHDDALREGCFESLLAVTGIFCGYDPDAPRPGRLVAIARLRQFWNEKGGAQLLRRPPLLDPQVQGHALELVLALGEGSDTVAAGDNDELVEELVALGQKAVPALLQGLTFPRGYWHKRELACRALGRIGSKDAAPALAAALRDDAPPVVAAAAEALESAGDPAVLPQIARCEQYVRGWRLDSARSEWVERVLAALAQTRSALESLQAAGSAAPAR